MKYFFLLFLCFCSISFADDIYLKTNSVLKNYRCDGVVEGYLIAVGSDRTRKVPLNNVLKIDTISFDNSRQSILVSFENPKEAERIINNWKNNISDSEVPVEKQSIVTPDNSNLVTIQTLKGETIIGEFVSATDTTATYKISSGLLTLMKSNILSVNKNNNSPAANAPVNTPDIDLPADKAKQYNQKRISIELEGVGTSSLTSLTKYSMVGMYSDWKKWTAFEGFNKISEEGFFKIAGYQKEADLAASFHQSAGQYTRWGVLSSLAGAVVLYLAYTNKETMKIGNMDVEYISVSTGGAILGYSLTTLGGIMVIAGAAQENKNYAPYSLVQSIADEYNKKLVLSIRKNF